VADEPAWADPVVVPDDIRELQPDVDAYHRELRLARRRRRWAWLTGSPAWQRWSFPVGVLTGAIALAAVVFALLAVDGARGRLERAAPAPLAAPRVAAGSVGGLLPDVSLISTSGTTLAARELRPALVALIPPHCACTQLLTNLAAQAEEVQVRLVVVGPGRPDADIDALPGAINRGTVVATYDVDSALTAAYDARGVTALIVGPDGVVTDVAKDVSGSTRLEYPLESALLALTGRG
jgi:hypothetical protein